MRKESVQRPAQVSLGDVQLDIDRPDAGVQKTYRGERTDNLVGANALPAGAYYIQVKHIDPLGGQILVNGEPLGNTGASWHAEDRIDRTNNSQDFCEAVEIQADGTAYYLRVSYPSNDPFDPSTLES
ncbi:MAG: hypothetical protein AAF741_15650 [Bacteroidota bacterium]